MPGSKLLKRRMACVLTNLDLWPRGVKRWGSLDFLRTGLTDLVNCQVLEAQIDTMQHQGHPELQRRELHPAGHQNVIGVDDDI